jgi:hypothetical protein
MQRNNSQQNIITSPNGKLQVSFSLNKKGTPLYEVNFAGKTIVQSSQLGLVRNDCSFAENLVLLNVSEPKEIIDNYEMLVGKRKMCRYYAFQKIFTLKNQTEEIIEIIFQVSNNGVIFRYVFKEDSKKTFSIEEEKTSFAFDKKTVCWLSPIQPAKTGWEKTQPSYEEYYEIEKPVGTASPTGEGWGFPGLFKTADDIWILICDSDVDENYCAARLANDCKDGIYKIGFPHTLEHRGEIDPVKPEIKLPFVSPWRVLIIGDSLDRIVQSTIITDVAAPAKIKDCEFVKPGRAAWHWLRLGDDSAKAEIIEQFIDFAAHLHWEYVLIDADWDKNIGYEKITAVVQHAAKKNIGIILWYNSNGNWNTAPFGPKNRMHEKKVRREEFSLLKKIGVKGVKIDFFGGDKQASMKLYLDILKDAAEFGIMVNFHGSTIPRGWQRTYPNLMSMEAVRGMEFCTFEQANADNQPQHCCMTPFTRNIIGSMDFTPVVFNSLIRNTHLLTTPVFELALSVIFESGIQHFGLVPDELKLMPDFVQDFLRKVPTTWDMTYLLAGYPGKYVVMARQKDNFLYIAGINGQKTEQKVNLPLQVIEKEGLSGILISDGPDRTFIKKSLESLDSCDNLLLKPNGGFIIWLNKK